MAKVTKSDQTEVPPLWARPTPAGRGPQPAHSRDRIADAAVKIADAEGMKAVSMRRVASEIGTRASSLYRYVQSKEELLELMVDRVAGEMAIPPTAGDWRADLRAIAHHTHSLTRRHPWMILISVRSSLGPNSLAITEATLRALDGRGLDADGMLVVATALSTFTRGWAAQEIAEQESEASSSLGRDQWMASQEPYGKVISESGEYPLFTRIMREARTPHDTELMQRGFELGLEYLLDGIAARLS